MIHICHLWLTVSCFIGELSECTLPPKIIKMKIKALEFFDFLKEWCLNFMVIFFSFSTQFVCFLLFHTVSYQKYFLKSCMFLPYWTGCCSPFSLITSLTEHGPRSWHASWCHHLGWHPPVAGLLAHQPLHLLLLPRPPERSQHHP